MIEIVQGNILDSKEKYICHQCNCVTNTAMGLAKNIFIKYPYSNVYKDRIKFDQAGTIIISGNGNDQRYIINIMAQVYPGSPKFPDSNYDGTMARIGYFRNCLNKIKEINNLESISFPFQIGCGMAGGDWNTYSNMIEVFANNTPAIVKIYKL
ncbi:MAG: Appr-1-p processing protein [Nanoarchaeota archaeon]